MQIKPGDIALVTGASQGLGVHIARALAQRGVHLVLAARSAAALEQVAATLRTAANAEVITVPTDVADPAALERLIAAATERFGRVDILVNNAGYGERLATTEIDEGKFDRMFAVHVKGSFFFTRAVVRGMKERRRGKIINISSIWGMTGAPVAAHYCAAKAALLGFTKAWAKEFAPWSILVNAVAPGGVRSGGPMKLDNSEILRAKEEKVPLKRYCDPREISYAVAFLASAEADFITGQVISPNGGEVIVGI